MKDRDTSKKVRQRYLYKVHVYGNEKWENKANYNCTDLIKLRICFIRPDCITFLSVSANFNSNSEIKIYPKILNFYNYIFTADRQTQKHNV
jgi:hypothetical protein